MYYSLYNLAFFIFKTFIWNHSVSWVIIQDTHYHGGIRDVTELLLILVHHENVLLKYLFILAFHLFFMIYLIGTFIQRRLPKPRCNIHLISSNFFPCQLLLGPWIGHVLDILFTFALRGIFLEQWRWKQATQARSHHFVLFLILD